MQTWFSVLLVHCLGNILSVRLVDQMGSGVGLLAMEFRVAMAAVVELWITHYSLDSMLLASNFYCLN